MKKVFYILLTVTALFFASCSMENTKRGSVWVMQCENGRLKVDDTGHYDSWNHNVVYKITAFPNEGYCLEKGNLFVHEIDGKEFKSYGKYGKDEVQENVFTVSVDYDADVIITAYFTKKEAD